MKKKKPGPEIAFWITFILILVISMVWFVKTAKGEGLVSEEEVNMLAKTVWGEARGLDEYERSLVIWCILNRFDNGKFGSSIKEIITKPYQFQGYKESFPIDEDILRLCKDVIYRWENSLEGRTLPAEYSYFYGDEKHNYYTTDYKGGTTYDFSLPNPYEGERGHYYKEEIEMADENKTPEEMIEAVKNAVGAITEIVSLYKESLDRNTDFDEATKIMLTLDFQRTFIMATMGGNKNG